MAADIPTIEPESFRAGDTVKWTKALADYLPDDGWVLKYTLNKIGQKTTITATDNGDGTHLASVSAATSAAYKAGVYKWQSYVEYNSERYTIATGTIEIKPDLTAAGLDTRSHVKKVLDAIEAVIENRATLDQESYTIGNRSLKRMSLEELLKFRDTYKMQYNSELQAERLAMGLGTKNKVMVRF